jgi:GLPGLI family protein
MTRISMLLVLLIFAARATDAQNSIFLSQGKIEFERKINQYARMEAQMEGDEDGWSDLQKKMTTKFKTDYFDLLFTSGKTLYKPGRESPDKPNAFFFFQAPAQDNVIYADLADEKATSQKKAFEEVFLVQDTLRKIKWKITDETRTIAGFTCRRANALIMDSVYVVAFYTDEILTSGGPESFTGLPGMILGVSLPHEHISWFATRVEAVTVPEAQVAAPVKGKKVNNAGMLAAIQRSLKDWGKEGRQYMEILML